MEVDSLSNEVDKIKTDLNERELEKLDSTVHLRSIKTYQLKILQTIQEEQRRFDAAQTVLSDQKHRLDREIDEYQSIIREVAEETNNGETKNEELLSI